MTQFMKYVQQRFSSRVLNYENDVACYRTQIRLLRVGLRAIFSNKNEVRTLMYDVYGSNSTHPISRRFVLHQLYNKSTTNRTSGVRAYAHARHYIGYILRQLVRYANFCHIA